MSSTLHTPPSYSPRDTARICTRLGPFFQFSPFLPFSRSQLQQRTGHGREAGARGVEVVGCGGALRVGGSEGMVWRARCISGWYGRWIGYPDQLCNELIKNLTRRAFGHQSSAARDRRRYAFHPSQLIFIAGHSAIKHRVPRVRRKRVETTKEWREKKDKDKGYLLRLPTHRDIAGVQTLTQLLLAIEFRMNWSSEQDHLVNFSSD
ncbi:hypothetical protein K439DRAFT_378770 [Ramaria rubella]|nr:hypothetical protein K439DRAFT_378770 [Ramaria rubella]